LMCRNTLPVQPLPLVRINALRANRCMLINIAGERHILTTSAAQPLPLCRSALPLSDAGSRGWQRILNIS
jgi:hypothetical protein